jgi:hypothetical protein
MGNNEVQKIIDLKVARANITEGEKVEIVATPNADANTTEYRIHVYTDAIEEPIAIFPELSDKWFKGPETAVFDTSGRVSGTYTIGVVANAAAKDNEQISYRRVPFRIFAKQEVDADVTLHRSAAYPTNDQGLWVAIRNRTNALSFDRYQRFIDFVFRTPDETVQVSEKAFYRKIPKSLNLVLEEVDTSPPINLHGPYAYSVLKFATQVFLTLEAGVVIREHGWGEGHKLLDSGNEQSERYRLDDPSATYAELKNRLEQYLVSSGNLSNSVLPYLDRIVSALLKVTPGDPLEVLPHCQGILQHRLTYPSLIELIWSYWHEEGMLAQTMNAIAMRFQNQRMGPHDPLAELEVDPLRPLNNLIWGYIQDEHNRLTVRRRAFEYDHHYGLKLVGRAVPELHSADRRSKFIEAFHNLLYRTAVFFREDSDTTVVADAFPLLNALKDVHLLLAEGAHNQYGDLPWTSRAEMLTEQYMLARPEMREFLRGRHMVPYQEQWMGAVDAMKKLQGWSDTTVTHFNELAVDGERILLSIRFGDWSELDNTAEQAKNWARYWKPEIQRYLYGFLAATGVDLMADITDNREAATRYLQPSTLLQQRLAAQARRPALAVPQEPARLTVRPTNFADRALPAPARASRYLKGA